MSKKIIAAIIIILVIIVGLYQYNRKVPSLESINADYSLSSNELYDAFENDEKQALTLYENKVIDVSGKVLSIKEEGGTSVIVIESENAMIGGINCSFNEKINNIQEGQVLTIRGRCQGFLMDVILNNCIIINE
ncbi:MAG: hypothetical protein DWP98_02400 [Bacteroidetes bacterium]|nr:MAG: hypothetical protein DWP98_02400 [Bacteroidota bacterium]MBL1143942.1 hypothetical protein [Bacteroidota bacterium]MCB0802381.1 hypothetical protein [Flavobacteriales bacterium]NOG56743.1 hypothetical protein [Bacteroidota bacterium]